MIAKVTTVFASLLTLVLFTNIGVAKEFAPQTAAQFQADLTEAAGNNEDDTITLAAMTYRTADNGNQSFTYDSDKDRDLSIVGQGMGQTFLDNEAIPNNRVIQLLAKGSGTITVQGVTIQGGLNATNDGTGIEVDAKEGDIHFLENEVKDNNGVEVTGVDLHAHNNGNIFIERCRFINNNSTQVASNSVHAHQNGNITFQDNIVMGNTAQTHSGISLQLSDGVLLFNRNLVLDNHATDGDVGGALLYSAAGEVVFTNNIVSGNTATKETGGILISPITGPITVVNNTVTGNTAGTNAGGINLNVNDTSITRIYNNIVYGNAATADKGEDIFIDDIFTIAPVVELFYNNFSEFCFHSGSCDPSALGADEGENLNVDPLFVDLLGNDFRLQESSPVVDQGTKDIPGGNLTADFSGNSRTQDLAPDMGALEFTPEPPPAAGEDSSETGGGCSLTATGNPNSLWSLWLLALPLLGIRFFFTKRV